MLLSAASKLPRLHYQPPRRMESIMDRRGKNKFPASARKATAQGRATFQRKQLTALYDRLTPGTHLESTQRVGKTWEPIEGIIVQVSGETVWWIAADNRARLRRSHRHRCTPIPSPAEIKERAKEIRQGWTVTEHARRGRYIPLPHRQVLSRADSGKKVQDARDFQDRQRQQQADQAAAILLFNTMKGREWTSGISSPAHSI